MTRGALNAIALALVLAACQASAGEGEPASAPAGEPAGAPLDKVPAFAQAVCGGCHALAPPDLSPNPEAPPFADIANRPGLTAETLSTFLSDAHNYPEAMEFTLEPSHVEQLTAYIMTLRKEGYEPPPS